MNNTETANTTAEYWHDRARHPAGDYYPLLRRLIWLAIVYGMLIVTLRAQETPRKADSSPAAFTAREFFRWLPQK